MDPLQARPPQRQGVYRDGRKALQADKPAFRAGSGKCFVGPESGLVRAPFVPAGPNPAPRETADFQRFRTVSIPYGGTLGGRLRLTGPEPLTHRARAGGPRTSSAD